MAKKRKNKIPRKQKKALKKQAQKVVQKQTGKAFEKVSTREAQQITKKESQRIRRNEQARARREAFKNAAKNSGIPEAVLKANNVNSMSALEAFIPKYTRQQQKIARIEKKKRMLMDGGYTAAEAAEIAAKDPTFDKIKSLLRNDTFTYSAKDSLYIGFADTTGKNFDASIFNSWTTRELKETYYTNLYEAELNPEGGSPDMCGIFTFAMGSKSDIEYRASVYYKRGYDMTPDHLKLDARRYSKLTVSNKWSEFEFWRMAATITSQMKNSQILDCDKILRRYCARNKLPFMD